ncbi:DsbA family protein [Lelliottia sp. V89_10]|uniref:DsbA family protein n=1 Tax=Lelliottia wanjuensis TaxID=3050585 RepID=A0AAP4FWG3_9ENTR|nr:MULTISPECIES: DsbA family protein [unclassified Lelliottia]MDI3360723.1 DsbA family protein [Lelliottia sp. V89_13]MDK9363142.1 DsbA family protein [Lelliottia sp. V106_12]MDK9547224.1 DsbA family protein [Lelliottia sp. V89_5]MDK9594432.1 DsbA family protein [Lelliottia sp. V89_10]MDK9618397.1 DsbA family protein [Lelliottia sp. V106_9]
MRILATLLLFCFSTLSLAAEPDLENLLWNDPDTPAMGAEKPRLTLVSFTDYNCPYCKQFDPELEKIVQKFPDVKLVVKLLPFRSESSANSARIALTAWRQQPQQYWDLHHRLMSKKGYHDDASILAAQQKTGTAAIKADEKSGETLQMNLILAQVLGVQGTPATLVGKTMVPGAIPYDDLEALVKEELAKQDAQ